MRPTSVQQHTYKEHQYKKLEAAQHGWSASSEVVYAFVNCSKGLISAHCTRDDIRKSTRNKLNPRRFSSNNGSLFCGYFKICGR